MSAAATAAGYLYASGRLRGRSEREQNGPEKQREEKPAKRREPRVAVYAPETPDRSAEPQARAPERKTPKTPRIEYRTRRWRPNE
jgi:hypothetical protein